MDTILANFIWLIGNGEHINLWLDNWLGTPLVSIFNIHHTTYHHLNNKLSIFIADGKWKIPVSFWLTC